MGGREIGEELRIHAGNVRDGEAIVELGVWLGAGTAQMASAVAGRDVEIHGYDRFEARGSEVEKAAAQGVALKPHQDTQTLVRRYLAPIGATVILHRGNITSARPPGRRIGLHVDDACKRPRAFLRALKRFSPRWIPGRTVVVLMDVLYWMHKPDPELRFQYDFVCDREESFLELWRAPTLSCAAYLYRAPFVLDPALLARYDPKRRRR